MDRGPLVGSCAFGQLRTFAHDWTAHSFANLRRVQIQFRQRSAQRVSVHPQLRGGLALVTLVMRKNFQNVAPLELTDGVRIRDSGTVHMSNQGVQFALQGLPRLLVGNS